jgi:hypothetical protein
MWMHLNLIALIDAWLLFSYTSVRLMSLYFDSLSKPRNSSTSTSASEGHGCSGNEPPIR